MDLDLLELNIDLGSVYLELYDLKEVKKNLKTTNELYQKLKKSDNTQMDEHLKGREGKTFDNCMRTHHVNLLKNYEQYYTLLDQPGKLAHNGILVIKYQLKYDTLDTIEWIEHAVDLTAYCCEARAFRQSHYLLRAAELMLANFQTDLKASPHIQKMNQSRFLEGRIKLAYVQHCLILLYETQNIFLITEKIKKGAILSDEQKKDLQIHEEVMTFDDLAVPDGDVKFNGLLESSLEIRDVYEKVKKLMKDVANRLSEDERNAHGYEIMADKMYDLLNSYPFLS